MDTTKVRITIDLETEGETVAEELGWILNLLRFELAHWPKWRGKIRRLDLVNPGASADPGQSSERRTLSSARPPSSSPPESPRG
jgi:hypothetical protein